MSSSTRCFSIAESQTRRLEMSFSLSISLRLTTICFCSIAPSKSRHLIANSSKFFRRSCSLYFEYFSAEFACRCNLDSCLCNSSRISLIRSRFSSARLIRFSVSRRRSLYFEMPAASSTNTRSSWGRASISREIISCSMIA